MFDLKAVEVRLVSTTDKRRRWDALAALHLCDVDGRPVAVEVFDGNTADPNTVPTVVERVNRRFGLKQVVVVGDRGMLTEARINDGLKPAALD